MLRNSADFVGNDMVQEQDSVKELYILMNFHKS